MELICPDCRGELQMAEGATANCGLHGGVYEVLFDREAESTPKKTAALAIDDRMCDAHPRQSAIADCASCSKALCGICSFDVAERHYCSDCAIRGAEAPQPITTQSVPAIEGQEASGAKECPVCGTQAAVSTSTCSGCGHVYRLLNLSPSPRIRVRVPAGLKCAQHTDVDAVTRCRACSNGVCETCDFQMPGGLHFCPACIDNAGNEDISPRRTKMAIGAIVLAVYCPFMFGFMITGTHYRTLGSPSDLETLGCIVMLLIYAPSIAGTSIAATAFDRRLRNTPIIWTALVWNIVVIAVLGIQFIIGIVSS